MTIKYYLSGGDVGSGNTDPDESIGGVVTTQEIVDASTNNLFDIVSGIERLYGSIDYRCIFLKSEYTDFILQDIEIWIESISSGIDDNLYIGFGTAGVNNPEQIISDESTAPDNIIWTTSMGAGSALLSAYNLMPSDYLSIWFKRKISYGDFISSDNNAIFKLRGNISAINPPTIVIPDAPVSILSEVID